MRLIVLVVLVAVLVVAIVAVLEVVQAALGVWRAMDTVTIVQDAMGVENVLIDVIVFLVQRYGVVVVVLVYLDVYLIVILAITEVAIHAMMCLVGVNGLLVLVVVVMLVTGNNV